MKALRLKGLPEGLRTELKEARLKRGWSQLELGQHIGLPQVHISGIETGKTVPRFNTLLDLVRVLDFDLVMVPRTLVPAVHALIRDSQAADEDAVQPLYAFGKNDESHDDD